MSQAIMDDKVVNNGLVILEGEFDEDTLEEIADFLSENGWEFINTRGLWQLMVNEKIGITITKGPDDLVGEVILPCKDGFFLDGGVDRLRIHRIIIRLNQFMAITFSNKRNRQTGHFWMEVA